ncbi:MAG TPA: hypothetical protein VMT79_01195 [Candidatus Binatia bacterium]|nr:hypothetical protein [Candidatus Binatia bacterium]
MPAQFPAQQRETVDRWRTRCLTSERGLGAPGLGGGQGVAIEQLLGPMSDFRISQGVDRGARTLPVARIFLGGGRREQAQINLGGDARLLLASLRHLIEAARLTAARQLLDAAPLGVLNDPVMMRLRAALAPPVVTRIQRRDVDRQREYEWLRTEGPRYRGCWVALEGNTLVASAKTLRELRKDLQGRRNEPLLLHRID